MNLNKTQTLALPMLLGLAAVYHFHGLAATAILAFVSLAVLAPLRSRTQLGIAPDANEIASELNLSEVLDSALFAFKRAILPIRMFSTIFQNVVLRGDNKVQVPYYPLAGMPSKDFNGTYDFTKSGNKKETREIEVDQRKYQTLAATSAEIARLPQLNLETLGMLKGEKLAYDIVADVLGLVTAARFGTAVFTGAASGFDTDDVIDIDTACNENRTGPISVTDGATTNTSLVVTSATAYFTPSDLGSPISGTGIPVGAYIAEVTSETSIKLSAAATATATGLTLSITRPIIPWPKVGRGLLLNSAFDGALKKDTAVKSALAAGSDSVIKEGRLPRVLGFDYAESAAVPLNGENLVGMAAYQSALLVALSPVEPKDGGKIVDYRVVSDKDTGISIEYRNWFDPDEDKLKQVIECNYGRAAGERLALKRICKV